MTKRRMRIRRQSMIQALILYSHEAIDIVGLMCETYAIEKKREIDSVE